MMKGSDGDRVSKVEWLSVPGSSRVDGLPGRLIDDDTKSPGQAWVRCWMPPMSRALLA
jgi:hypothetical protein